ncbi:MAG: DUF2513 domain-containing protein [Thermomicrobiales bacterium]
MKRDWNLVREILLRLEDQESSQEFVRAHTFVGHSPELVSYQISLLIDAGLVEGNCATYLNAPKECWAQSLTWEGHEFLDGIRSETVWNSVKTLLKGKGIDLTIDSIKAGVAIVVKSVLSGGT